ncbi:uncharacterized protein LOC143473606 [Brachyhypopomus gauderio]|uniref:uncharacterized protein LOC143473606 n=1 Tax=Brachyhypopomus gauderio TaxID=698409 RepID=UPI00404288C0
MRKILYFIFFLPTIKMYSADSVTGSVKHVPFGSTITIPCEGYAGNLDVRWMYKREDKIESLVKIVTNKIYYNELIKQSGTNILRNFTLQINNFSHLNEGTYYCEVCRKQYTYIKQISLITQYDTFCPSARRQFIIKGHSFSFSCLHDMGLKLNWKFKAHGQSTVTPVKRELTNASFLFMLDVQPSAAGEYTCWRETSTGQQHRVCSVFLCVLTVTDMELSDSPQICTVHCDMDIDAAKGSPVIYVTNKWNISVTGTVNNSKHSVNCNLHRNNMETNRSSFEKAHVTIQSDITAGITVDDAYSTHSQKAIFISMASAVFFILIIIVIICLWVLQQRANADKNSGIHQAARSSEGENQSHLVYSTLEVRRYQHQNVITPENECVYSQVKAQDP